MIYEYECKSCKELTTVVCSVSETTDQTLCACGEMADKIISSGAIYYEANFHSLRNDRTFDLKNLATKPRKK